MLRRLLLYGIMLGVITFLLKWLEYRYIITSHAFEIYAGLIAVFFTGLGIWAGKKLTSPKIEKEIVVVEKMIPVPAAAEKETDHAEIQKRGISQREMEVLHLIAEGLSNQEIADRLFVSLNTVKTHTSNLFLKLEVGRRTMAVQKAKEINILQ